MMTWLYFIICRKNFNLPKKKKKLKQNMDLIGLPTLNHNKFKSVFN